MGDLQIDFGFFHRFEKTALNAGAGHIGAEVLAAAGDFVDFVDVNDAILGQIGIVIGLPHQVPHEVFDVSADITGLTELGGIALDERNPDFLGDQLDNVRLADTGWAKHQDIVFNAADHHAVGIGRSTLGAFDAVEMGANFCGQNGLGPILLDDVLIEEGD